MLRVSLGVHKNFIDCFLELFPIYYFPNTFWFPGSPIFCLAIYFSLPQLSCLGQTLGGHTEREKSGGCRFLLPLPALPPQDFSLSSPTGLPGTSGKGEEKTWVFHLLSLNFGSFLFHFSSLVSSRAISFAPQCSLMGIWIH